MTFPKLHLSAGLEAALVAKWAIFSAVIADKLSTAFLQGSFATLPATIMYFQTNWWILLVSGIVAVLTGGVVRGQTKSNYINRVEAGVQPPPPTPIVAPPQSTVVSPSPQSVTVAGPPPVLKTAATPAEPTPASGTSPVDKDP